MDIGNDYLCCIIYGYTGDMIYILDVVYTKDSMEHTEPLIAERLTKYQVNRADIESNNGGRGFGSKC